MRIERIQGFDGKKMGTERSCCVLSMLVTYCENYSLLNNKLPSTEFYEIRVTFEWTPFSGVILFRCCSMSFDQYHWKSLFWLAVKVEFITQPTCRSMKSISFVLLCLPIDFVYLAEFIEPEISLFRLGESQFSLRRRQKKVWNKMKSGKEKNRSAKWSFHQVFPLRFFALAERFSNWLKPFTTIHSRQPYFYVKYIRIHLVKGAAWAFCAFENSWHGKYILRIIFFFH